jgi:hypothetical protein
VKNVRSYLKAVLASRNKHLARLIGVVPNDKLPLLDTQRAALQAAREEVTMAEIAGLGKPNIFLFLLDLPVRFIFALIGFIFMGWIGWAGIVLVLLRVFGVIHWPWWLAALPLEYGVIYCLYMTIDGALYRAGLKKVGGYARFTQNIR